MRRVIDDRGRIFGLVSFIDVLAFIAAVLIAAALLGEFDSRHSAQATIGPAKITFEISVKRIRASSIELLRPGDKLFTGSDIYLGVIRDIAVTDATSAESLIDGTYVIGKSYERYDIVLTVEASGSFKSTGYYLDNGYKIKSNSEHTIYTKYNSFLGAVLSVGSE